MKIPEPKFFSIFKTKFKDRFYRKSISVRYNGKRERVKLLPMGEMFRLQRYKFEDRRLDALTELSEYTGDSLDVTEKRLMEAEAQTDKKFSSEPRNDDESVRKFYAGTPEYIYCPMRASFEFRHLTKRANTALSVSLHFGKKDVMDFGGGSGRDALTFARKGFNVTHVDCLGHLTDFAKWRYQRRGLNVSLLDSKDLARDKRTYDVIVCFDVLEHIIDPLRWLKVFYDKLNEKGLLFIFADFDNLDTPLHLPENTKFYHQIEQELCGIGFKKIGHLGISMWTKG